MIENFGLGIDISNIEKFRNKPFNENESFYRKSIELLNDIDRLS